MRGDELRSPGVRAGDRGPQDESPWSSPIKQRRSHIRRWEEPSWLLHVGQELLYALTQICLFTPKPIHTAKGGY